MGSCGERGEGGKGWTKDGDGKGRKKGGNLHGDSWPPPRGQGQVCGSSSSRLAIDLDLTVCVCSANICVVGYPKDTR